MTQLPLRLVPPVLPVRPEPLDLLVPKVQRVQRALPVRPEPLDLLVPKVQRVQRALQVRPETLAQQALLVPPDLLALTG